MKIGVIGGTGLYALDGLVISERRAFDTPFGKPSADLIIGRLHNREVVFLPRHGAEHRLLPSEIDYRANIWALKAAGVREVVAVSAVGSLREEVRPGDLALASQYFDWTRGKRNATFFGDGVVAHISSAEPACPQLTLRLSNAAQPAGITLHTNKVYACVEGPRLGTRAESLFLRGAGCDLVGMTNVPEAFLAREAQLCYVTVAVVTDYDCWKEEPSEHVNVEQVMALYKRSLGKVQSLLAAVLGGEPAAACSCRKALAGAVLSDERHLNEEQKARLEFLRG